MIRRVLLGLAFMALMPSASDAQWREPPRTMQPAQQRFTDCRAVDGDTLACRQGRVRLRGVDTPERGESGYRAAQQELR
jgi:endonuclease YncB( thermonuclease family)